ncbi:sulfatase-like hydrolase/transferase [Marivita hallyeonensis]|uniref:Sulfatase n=1 Tax=Marivita hallyeonensis TaxID=996342 RepID=A0A1M5S780_9RHOB|nr:sulfatase-like hydrolase/transferase [Marivita hallyeonensis]SHH34457.1 Sulfatase [Marivita hallyeonensis]
MAVLKERVRTAFWALLAALVLHLVLIQPNHPDAVSWRALMLFPLELPAILLALLAFGQSRAGFALRIALVGLLTASAALKAADFGMFMSLNRGFNPVGDLPLIVSLYQLVVGAFGVPAAVLAVIAAVAAVLAVALLLWWACATWARLARPTPIAAMAGLAAVFAGTVAVAEIGSTLRRWSLPIEPPGAAFTARVVVERYEMVRDTLADLRRFRAAAREDTFAGLTGLFDLVDRDVLVVFVESYGRTSFDTPFYADLHLETLRSAESRLSFKGLAMASTFLTAPTRGGQSWLSHASFANGLWVNNQTSYRAVLGSGRQTIFHLAAGAGFHTAAVMPQITMAWPESQTMGFETILAAEDLGYKGEAFNWITMPDQFTFAAMDRILRPSDRPMFVQLATGSSHAPWVPVPTLLDWDALGDGTIFDPVVAASDPPSVVWRDHDRVRAQYKAAVDYALQTVFSHAERHADNAPLILVIGDHQAAGFVALDERPHVPMHVIGPRHLVDLLADENFAPGLIPRALDAPRPMSELRAHLVRSLTSTPLARSGQ